MAFLLSSLSLKLAAFSLTLSLPLCSRDTTREMDCSVHWFEIEMRQVRGRKARARKESTVFFLVERVLKKKSFFPLRSTSEKKEEQRKRTRERARELPFSPLALSLLCSNRSAPWPRGKNLSCFFHLQQRKTKCITAGAARRRSRVSHLHRRMPTSPTMMALAHARRSRPLPGR
jgi:hypothetical protein